MDKKILEFTNVGARSPGPAEYCIKPTIGKGATDPSIETNPAYSIRGNKLKNACPVGPGPAYHTERLTRYGKERTPGGVMGISGKTQKTQLTPGPADYCVGPARVVGGYKMQPSSVRPADCKQKSPAPNAYLLPNTLSGRATQLGQRFRSNQKCPLPGPGQYDLPHADLYLPGTFRMGRSFGKRFDNGNKCPTPGPADYDGLAQANCCPVVCDGRNNRRVCRTTFGIRRPDNVPTFAVPADNSYDCC